MSIMSDHNPVVGVVKFSLKSIKKKRTNKKHDMQNLEDPVIRTNITEEFAKYTQETKAPKELDAEIEVGKLKTAIHEICQRYLKPNKNIKKKSWVTEEIT